MAARRSDTLGAVALICGFDLSILVPITSLLVDKVLRVTLFGC